MIEALKLLELDEQTNSVEANTRPIANPSRREWEDRLASVLSELADLDQILTDEERQGDPATSPLLARRGELYTRVADLNWLIARSR